MSIQFKRSSVAKKIPVIADLKVGEIAINFPDKQLYTNNGIEIIKLGLTSEYTDATYLKLTGGIVSGAITAPTFNSTTGILALDAGTNKHVQFNTNVNNNVDMNSSLHIIPRTVPSTGVSQHETVFKENIIGTGRTNHNVRVEGKLQVFNNEVFHKGNVGIGSGLDADTFNSQPLTKFIRNDLRDQKIGFGDNSTSSRLLYLDGYNSPSIGYWATEDDGKHGVFYGYDGFADVATTIVRNESANTVVSTTSRSTGITDFKVSPTILSNKVWTSGNMGPGSLLDADLLDGLQGSAYAVKSKAETITNPWTFNQPVTLTGNNSVLKLIETDVTNNPEWWTVADGGNYSIRLNNASPYALTINTNSTNNAVTNVNIGADFTVLNNKVWHSGNMGAGSLLDADLLDGLNSTSFIRSDINSEVTSTITTRNGLVVNCGTTQDKGLHITRLGSYTGPNTETLDIWRDDAYANFDLVEDQAEADTNLGGFKFTVSQAIDVPTKVDLLVFNNNTITYKGQKLWHESNDGAGSTLDADLLDGQHGAFYQNATNITSGVLDTNRLPTEINSNAASATKLKTPRTISLSGVLSGSATYDGSENTIISTTLAPNAVTIDSVTGLRQALDAKVETVPTKSADSDKLDGIDSTGFMRQGRGSSLDLNTTTERGQYLFGNTVPNRPSDYGTLINYTSSGDYNGTNNWLTQLVYGTDGKTYQRVKINAGNYTPWAEYYTSQNKPSFADVGAVSATASYVGLDATGSPDYPRLTIVNNPGVSTEWLRAPSNSGGLIPYSTSNSSLGTTLWKWKEVHALNLYGELTGNSATSTKLKTPRSFSLTGGVTGSVTFDGSANVSFNAVVQNDSHSHTILSAKPTNTVYNNTNGNGLTLYQQDNNFTGDKPPYVFNTVLHAGVTNNRWFEIAGAYGNTSKLHWRNQADSTTSPSAWNRIYHEGDKPLVSEIGALGVNDTAINSSKLNNLSLNQMMPTSSLRDFTLGTLVTTDIVYANANGDPFYVQIRGNSYTGGGCFDTSFQGYIYNNTIINMSGNSIGHPIDPITAMNIDGNLCFWWPRFSYWQGFDVFVKSSMNASEVSNRVTSIDNVARPAGTKQIDIANIKRVYSETFKPTPSDIGALAESTYTAADIRTKLLTVDGIGSGIDADLLDGQQGSFYQNAANLNTGIIPAARLPTTITSSITGNSASATKLATARSITLTGGVTGTATFDGSANINILSTVSNDSHTHSTYIPMSGNATSKGMKIFQNTWSALDDFQNSPISVMQSDNAGSSIDVKYAPNINFHWSGRKASSLYMDSVGKLYWGEYTGSGIPQGAEIYTSANKPTPADIGAGDLQGLRNQYTDITVDGDANTYYPVVLDKARTSFGFDEISISRGYSWTAPNTWNTATHKGGLTLTVRYTGDSAWGGNDHTVRVVQFSEQYTTMVAGLHLSTSGLIVWLRGGGALYRFTSLNGTATTANVVLGNFTEANATVHEPRTTLVNITNEIYNKMPTRGSSDLYDRGSRVYSPSNKPSTTDVGLGNLSVGSNNTCTVTSSYGTTDIGMRNTTWSHYDSSSSNGHYFYKNMQVAGTVTAPTFTGSLNGNANTATTASDSNTVGGLSVHTGRNHEANKIVRTDSSGYLQTGWIHSTSGETTRGTRFATFIGAGDMYLYWMTAASMRTQLEVLKAATRTDWVSSGVEAGVVGQLAWNNYGNNHTIFDASKALTPTGTACSNSTPTNAWTPSYPTLMGFNGSSTYGVKVNRADVADNANAVGGISAASFMRADADDTFTGKHVSSTRDGGIYGTYDSTKTDHIWSMGIAYKNSSAGTNFGNLYGLAYKHTNNPTGGAMGGGHQAVWCTNGVPKASLGEVGVWSSGNIYAGGATTANASSASNNGVYSPHYYGSGNIGGTGQAIHCPAGVYSQGTNWLYGSIITSNNTIDTGTGKITCGSLTIHGHEVVNGSDTWLRTTGSDGVFFSTHGGGLHMTDPTWVRVYNSKKFYVSSTANDAIYTAGGILATQNVTAFSDARIKTDIEVIPDALDKISKIRGVTYTRTDTDGELRQTGVIAQELREVLPEAVLESDSTLDCIDDGKLLTVAYGNVIGLLIEGIKEEKAKRESVESEVSSLKDEIAKLTAMVEILLNK